MGLLIHCNVTLINCVYVTFLYIGISVYWLTKENVFRKENDGTKEGSFLRYHFEPDREREGRNKFKANLEKMVAGSSLSGRDNL